MIRGQKMTLSKKERQRRRRHLRDITTTAVHVAGGIAAGKIAASKPGYLDSIRTSETCRLGGQRGGTATAASGKLAATGLGLGIKTPESLSRGGRASCHKRWHLNKNRISENCEFCMNPPMGEAPNRS
jgi:hypothetical protein